MAWYSPSHSHGGRYANSVSRIVKEFTAQLMLYSTETTSAASTTTTTLTTRVKTTQTIFQTATTTLGQVVARAANIAAVAAVAEDIMNSVISSGTTAQATVTENEQRLQAESGLANACSCKMVDPTATVTETFTNDPVVSLRPYYDACAHGQR
jgi:hypothetical protein